MASPKNSRKRRSLYGSVPVPVPSSSKSFRLSIPVPDRLEYRFKSSEDNGSRIFNPESLISITERTWTVYRLSALHKLEYSTVKLKQYAAFIRNELVKSVTGDYSDVTFKVNIVELSGDGDNSSSLQIEVFYKKEDARPVLKYKALILYCGINKTSNTFTQLPLLLCAGAINITKIIHKSLTLLFDTRIFPLRISEEDLMWLSAMLCDVDTGESFRFEFFLNGNLSRNSVSFDLPSCHIKNLWNHIHPEDSEKINFEEVYNFHKQLQDQLQVIYGLNFNFCKLSKILMCDATIASEGKIRINTKDAAEKILSFLNDVSLLLDSPNPDMVLEISNESL